MRFFGSELHLTMIYATSRARMRVRACTTVNIRNFRELQP